jgi:hypothetical protein
MAVVKKRLEKCFIIDDNIFIARSLVLLEKVHVPSHR